MIQEDDKWSSFDKSCAIKELFIISVGQLAIKGKIMQWNVHICGRIRMDLSAIKENIC